MLKPTSRLQPGQRNSPELIDQALVLILISRNLECVADHATNFAEDVIFWVRGADAAP